VCFQDLDLFGRVDARYMVHAARAISRWSVRGEWSPQSTPPPTEWTAEYENEVRREITLQIPRTLAAGSDLIVLARRPKYDFPGPRDWTVERTLKGRARKRVNLSTVLPGGRPYAGERALLLLRRVGQSYEPVRVGAGIVPVLEDRVPSWNCSLEEAIARVSR
jgi:hypothetical protein